jgi:hypothetical protein
MQTKLDKFFEVKIIHKENNKKCFIYDPEKYKAFFENVPGPYDVYLTTKIGIKLYYRRPSYNKPISLPKIECKANVPLLKSNLQKAVRRCQTDIAIKSALAIIQKEPLELLRRLPVIYIEDVCLMDSYSIVVWLMMAEKEHPLDINDIDILLHIVKSLCETQTFYDYSNDYTKDFELTHKNLQDLENRDAILAVYYRSQYGGMKGDMLMLRNSVYYYSERPSEIEKTVYDCINYAELGVNLDIILEAIDFHPFPQMLQTLVKQTNLDNNDIKQFIWFVESGVNIRKQITIDQSREYSTNENWKIWKIIKSKLGRVRYNLMQYI